ncbi:hypothetical protein ACJW30_04G159100 [Castanea mollissima]
MAGKKIDIMESELERENSGLLSSVSDMVDGKIDEMLRGESGFVSFQSQLPQPASDLADGKNDPATSDTLLSLHTWRTILVSISLSSSTASRSIKLSSLSSSALTDEFKLCTMC